MSDGQVKISPKLVLDLKAFARVWDKNLEQQGFLKVAASTRLTSDL